MDQVVDRGHNTPNSLNLATDTSPRLGSAPVCEQREYLTGGALRHWDGPVEPVFSPLQLGHQKAPYLGSYPRLSSEAALETVTAASLAYDRGLGAWPQSSAFDRVQAVMQFAGQMLAVREEVVERLMWEIGKTRTDAEKEFDRTVDYIRESCAALLVLDEQSQETITVDGTSATVERTPLGVTLCMGPFNYPLNETFTTLIPALLMGNTTVLKPARYGVLLLEPLQQAFKDCFPAGVVNIVYGDGAEVISPIMQSGKVDVLAFIGSGKVADIVTAQHPEQHRLTKVLGLGAKNPAIVLADADLEEAVTKGVKGSLSYNGQRCTALKMHFVAAEIAEEYANRFADQVDALQSGMPWEPGVQLTPLAEGSEKIKFLTALVDDAVSHGARILNTGGGVSDGNLFTPAVLFPVTPEMRIYREEQFGPIVPIMPVDSAATAVEYIANSEYGQQVSVFGTDATMLRQLSRTLAPLVGRVNINDECKRGPDVLPFSARKSSALGTLSVTAALEIFSLPTVIARGQVQ